MTRSDLPPAIDLVVIPILNLLAALAVTGLVFVMIGVPPLGALASLLTGAFGSSEGVSYTLYYATDFTLTGLAVAIPYQAGLFNIGAEGQALAGGLGAALVCLALDGQPWWLVLGPATLAAMIGGGLWALGPALMQVYRGSHLVITTIMFNFIAAALMTWLLVDVLRPAGDPSPESAGFDAATGLPMMADLLGAIGIEIDPTPLNPALLIAVAAALVAWALLRRSVWGYELRTIGGSPAAARYAAIPVERALILAVTAGGAMAGLVGVNEVMGAAHRLQLDFTAGCGFIGIAVALMGRNHPLGIVLAALLFGALSQGGTELSFDYPTITRDVVVLIDGLVILFCGALEPMLRRPVAHLWRRWAARAVA